MKRLAMGLLLIFTAFCANGQSKAASDDRSNSKGIIVSPARLAFTLDRGATSKQSVTVKNQTSKKQQLVVELLDWLRDTVGDHIYYPPGTLAQSCSRWLTFDKPVIVLEPGQSTEVTLTLSVPDNADAVSEMKWSMLVIKSLQDKRIPTPVEGKYNAQIEKSIGMGIHVYEIPPSVTNKELKMTSFEPLPGRKNTYRVACKNVGALQLYGKFSVELSSSTGAKTALEAQTVPMFPKQDRYVDFVLPASLPKGKYTAVALIDANDDDVPVEAAQKEIIVQ